MITVELFVACDSHNVDDYGKVTLRGVFDKIEAPTLPATYGPVEFFIKLRIYPESVGLFRVTLSYEDPDGIEFLPEYSRPIEAKVPEGESSCGCNLILNTPNIMLPKYGEHKVHFSIDGARKATLRLFSKQSPDYPSLP